MWIFFIIIFIVLIAIPFLLKPIKRLVLFAKISACCKKHSYSLVRTHLFWFWASNQGKKCDFYIETPHEVFAIKLFGVSRRRTMLILKDNKEYFIRKFLVLTSDGAALRAPLHGKSKLLPTYNFKYKYKDRWKTKKQRCILLINPISLGVLHQPQYGREVIVGSGEIVNDMEISSFSHLLGCLKST